MEDRPLWARLLSHLRALSPKDGARLLLPAALLVLLLALPFLLGYGDETEEARLAERPPAAKSASRPAHVDVPRAKLTSEELRDPFSPLHERRGEAKAAGAAGSEAKLPAAPAPAAPIKPAGTVKKEAAVPRLTGVILGGEPLAMLELGERCEALKAGERIGAYRVERIEAGGALLSSPGGELWLSIPR